MGRVDWEFIPVPTLNILGFLLVLSSFSLSLFNLKNIGVIVMGLGTAFMALATGIDSLVWHGNTNDVAPVWCDIGNLSLILDIPLDDNTDHSHVKLHALTSARS